MGEEEAPRYFDSGLVALRRFGLSAHRALAASIRWSEKRSRRAAGFGRAIDAVFDLSEEKVRLTGAWRETFIELRE